METQYVVLSHFLFTKKLLIVFSGWNMGLCFLLRVQQGADPLIHTNLLLTIQFAIFCDQFSLVRGKALR